MSGRYSALSLLAGALSGGASWRPAWRSPEPKKAYDVVIIGGGGHGLASAYYLAKQHGVRNVAGLEKGWIGGGNSGRNTTIVRSDYYYPQSAAFFDHSVNLYGRLSRELNFNIMFSPRGMLTLAHSRGEIDFQRRLVNAMALNGVDTRLVSREETLRLCPLINVGPTARLPVLGGMFQGRAGTARHDAVVWGYARGADRLGVDILQNCEVTAIDRDPVSGAVTGVQTSRGPIATRKIGVAVAGHSTQLADMAGFRLPLRSYALQAFVSEPVQPVLHTIVSSSRLGVYVSQSDKGGLVIGGNADPFASFAQRGSLPAMESALAALIEMIPAFGRVKVLRQWAGIVDYAHDSSPVLGASPVPGLFLNAGWGGGGFKAIPASGECFAYSLATGKPHPLTEAFSLDRFRDLALVDEAAAAGIEH